MCGLLEASLCVACWRLACLWLAGDLLETSIASV